MCRNTMLKAIWGISKELGIEKEELYSLLFRETGKNGMRDCSDAELDKLLKVLGFFKDKEKLQKSGPTDKQLKFIHDLEKQIDWKKEKGGLQAFISA